MDVLSIILVLAAFFALGLYSGVWMTYKTYLKPAIDKGILEVGKDTYRVSKFVARNTRI